MFRVTILALCIIGAYGFFLLPELPGRIVGGVEANITEVPYQASLKYNGFNPHCGAAIVSSHWLVTAAHCIIPPYKPQVLVGSTYRNGTLYNVKRVIRHEKFNFNDYDISLIELETNLTFNEKVQPLKLATSEPKPGTLLVASGWGHTSAGGSSPERLRKVSLPLVDRGVCQKLHVHHNITERMICAGYIEEGGKDTCQGDSGGPLAADGILYGIVSFGVSCALPKNPGVYSNVANLRAWIKEKSGL